MHSAGSAFNRISGWENTQRIPYPVVVREWSLLAVPYAFLAGPTRDHWHQSLRVPLRLQLLIVWMLLGPAGFHSEAVADEEFGRTEALEFLATHCQACHQGEEPAAGFRTGAMAEASSFRTEPQTWSLVSARVSNHEMPPTGAPQPVLADRTRFVRWIRETWHSEACSAGLAPPATPVRRLNRDEFSATVRDLFDIQVDVSGMLPVDGPGGEGFDNAAETLFISPLLAEKYLEAASFVTDAAAKEFKSRERIFVARPGTELSEQEAAQQILARFLPRAFRRPVDTGTVDRYVRLVRRASRTGLPFEPAVMFALRSALVSPSFLFHVREEGDDPVLRQYALAARFSYFLWGSMPDELLLDAAAAGRMDDPAVLARLVPRMLRDPRSLEFYTRFAQQWLRTRLLETGGGPDPELFPEYAADAELRGDIRLQPVFFLREILRENRSLLDLIDSRGTVLTRRLIEHMQLDVKKEQDRNNPDWMDLPDGSERGGLLSMPAIAAVTSHPHRTSPVLRGVWILDSLLGTPPPPPPPDVPALDESDAIGAPKTVRERTEAHSSLPRCAGCHERIDPLGFALEAYDVLGRLRDPNGGPASESPVELPDGTSVEGPADLKQALLSRKPQFLTNLTRRMLGYALGRGLTIADECAVSSIVQAVERDDYQSWTLIREVVRSAPFLGR